MVLLGLWVHIMINLHCNVTFFILRFPDLHLRFEFGGAKSKSKTSQVFQKSCGFGFVKIANGKSISITLILSSISKWRFDLSLKLSLMFFCQIFSVGCKGANYIFFSCRSLKCKIHCLSNFFKLYEKHVLFFLTLSLRSLF